MSTNKVPRDEIAKYAVCTKLVCCYLIISTVFVAA